MTFPWNRLMRAGMGELRLPPDHFWRMTLKELAAVTGRETTDISALRHLIDEEGQ